MEYFHGKYFVIFKRTFQKCLAISKVTTDLATDHDKKTIQSSDSTPGNPPVADLFVQYGYHKCRRRQNIFRNKRNIKKHGRSGSGHLEKTDRGTSQSLLH